MNADYLNALAGGALIGVAVTVMLLFNGRVTGISGIIGGALSYAKKDWLWRFTFFLGLAMAGALLRVGRPEALVNASDRGLTTVILAGLLVGYGTLLGSGCTSGHGVCGISRMSVRSILATIAFILAGMVSVFIMRSIFGGAT